MSRFDKTPTACQYEFVSFVYFFFFAIHLIDVIQFGSRWHDSIEHTCVYLYTFAILLLLLLLLLSILRLKIDIEAKYSQAMLHNAKIENCHDGIQRTGTITIVSLSFCFFLFFIIFVYLRFLLFLGYFICLTLLHLPKNK